MDHRMTFDCQKSKVNSNYTAKNRKDGLTRRRYKDSKLCIYKPTKIDKLG